MQKSILIEITDDAYNKIYSLDELNTYELHITW